MSPGPNSISAIVVNFNSGRHLVKCIRSLKSQSLGLGEIIVVDNASTDLSIRLARALFPDVTFVFNAENVGFATAANRGATSASGDVLLFTNPDVTLSQLCAAKLAASLAESPGVVGPALTVDADNDDRFGGTIDRLGFATSLRSPGSPLYVSGAALATSRTLFCDLGGFDDRYFMFVEDVDYCWRVLLAGFEVSVCPDALASHSGGASAGGGYIRSGTLETTRFRLVARERNSLATLLKCAPVAWLLWLLPAYLAKTVILATGAFLLRKPATARELLAGLVWNVRQGSKTLRRRAAIVRTRAGQLSAQRRIYRGWLAAEYVRERGLPRLVD